MCTNLRNTVQIVYEQRFLICTFSHMYSLLIVETTWLKELTVSSPNLELQI
jgi:hypothetical protein